MVQFRRVATILLLGMALTGLGYSAYGDGEECPITTPVGSDWLATGTITKVDGPMFHLLGKDNQVYTVRAESTLFIVNDADGGKYTPNVGDTVRVFGKVVEGCRIDASRVRVYGTVAVPAAAARGPEKQVRIIIENGPTQPPAEAVAVCPPDWEGRGLIMDIDYTGRKLKVRTSTCQMTINLRNAQIINGGRLIRLGSLNAGDAVRVTGNIVGLGEIDAQQVYVTRTRDEAQNAVPQTPISIVGQITSVDYPSMTFTMQTGGPILVVLADPNTILQMERKPMSFLELKPGMRVKMSGNGNLTSGYVARHIQVISLAP